MDAERWRAFERRIEQRRAQALQRPSGRAQPSRRVRHAVALLALGVALLLLVDALRAPVTTPAAPITPSLAIGDTLTPVATTGTVDVVPIPTLPPAMRTTESTPLFDTPVRRPSERTAMSLPSPTPAPALAAAAVPLPVPEPIAVAVATPPPAPPVSAAVDPPPPDAQTRVHETLSRYARAYEQLDARAARDVWPSVDERALSNAFAGLASQSLNMRDCAIVVRDTEADAVCRGTASYVPRVGSAEPRVEPRVWHFELSRDGDEWVIDRAVARR